MIMNKTQDFSQKENAIEEALATLRELCKNKEEAIAFWQELHTPELDAYLERRRDRKSVV